MLAKTASRRRVMTATQAVLLTIAMTIDIEIALPFGKTGLERTTKTTIDTTNMTTEEDLAAMKGKRETTETGTIVGMTATKIEEITMNETIEIDTTMIGDIVTKGMIETATAERIAKTTGETTINMRRKEGETIRDRLTRANLKSSKMKDTKM